VLATDCGAAPDFGAFFRTTGNELVQSSSDKGVYSFNMSHYDDRPSGAFNCKKPC
jgi:hypothetical protein